jgi:predicted amidophosphoribosyltransferase
LVSVFEHDGAAQRLMHLLKYRGVAEFAELAAQLLESRVPSLPLVPVPRAMTRRLKYGVDPARVIASRLGRRIGAPVVPALVAELHTRRRAGRDHRRAVRPFRARAMAYPEVVVVDDVVTTGATMAAAIEALGPERVRMAVAANSVSGVSSLPLP